MAERSSFLWFLLVLAPFMVAFAAPAAGQGDRDPRPAGGDGGAAVSQAEGLAYRVEITGELEERLFGLLSDSSLLLREQERPPQTVAALRRRVRDDLDSFGKVLRSEGFYDATVAAEVADEKRPIEIELRVDTGEVYRLGDYRVDYRGPVEAELPRSASAVGLVTGNPARSEIIAGAETTLLRLVKRSGYPFAVLSEKRYAIDRQSRTLSGELAVTLGPRARFGPLSIEGLATVRESYVRRIAAWPEGSFYDLAETERLRQTLGGTGLFASVVVSTGEEVGPDGRLPVAVRLQEAPHRTIGFGVGYSTDEGPEGDVLWEHRNLLGAQENLRLRLGASAVTQSGVAAFRKPHFRRLDQSLALASELAREDSDAFQEIRFSQFVGLERKLGEHWTASAGPVFELSRIEDGLSEETFGLLGFLVGASYESRDDPLDATRGFRLDLSTTPYLNVYDEQVAFWINEASGSTYLALDDDKRFVLAARARLGSVMGSARADLPASKRFFAGGGGSVRGYEFRKVGPLDEQNDPIGGRSVVETGLELRLRLTENLGLVPFLEGGQVYPDAIPDFGESLLWAAGIGLRYYSVVGPIRLDLAFPLDRREGVDDDFQFYISLGQAF